MAATEQPAPRQRLTQEDLARADGKEGRPAYFAYRGRVYDVSDSRFWRKGIHVKAHRAGENLTGAMPAAPHGEEVLERYRVVGVLIEEAEGPPAPKLPLPVQLSLDHHLHPIAVHFPAALGATAPLFILLSLLLTGRPELYETFQAVAFWNLVICALSTVPAIATGVISWYYNYSAVWTPIYRVKWSFSGILLVLSVAALVTRWLALRGSEPTGAAFWIYTVLVLLIAPTVVILGHYGGKITFPS